METESGHHTCSKRAYTAAGGNKPAAFQSGLINDGFGASVDISGRYILIGAPADHRCPAGQVPGANHYGRTYLYYDQRNSDYNSWQLDQVFQGISATACRKVRNTAPP